MAEKRMISKPIVRTDKFLDMPVSSRELYFQLQLDADAKGFVSPKTVMRIVGATTDDLQVLIAKEYLIPFNSGVIVVTHWKVHNNIREDREAPSQYIDEYKQLFVDKQSNYSRLLDNSGSTPGELPPKLGKVSLNKIKLNKDNINSKRNNYNKLNSIKDVLNEKYPEIYDTTKQEI